MYKYGFVLFILGVILLVYLNRVESFQTDSNSDEVGFIVTRCVKKPEQNMLYYDCYMAIRRFHPDLKIIFIDDNSDKNILEEMPMKNVEIIQSEFPGAGEYLPYYYLLTRNLFKKAIIIQDSMIVNTSIPYENVADYRFLYEFGGDGTENDERRMHEATVEGILRNTKMPNELINFYKSYRWMGCWGSCMVITYDFLRELESKMEITRWKTMIKNRELRMGLERAIAVVCSYIKQQKYYSLFGNINNMQVIKTYGSGNYTISLYLEDKTQIKDKIIKIWNGR